MGRECSGALAVAPVQLRNTAARPYVRAAPGTSCSPVHFGLFGGRARNIKWRARIREVRNLKRALRPLARSFARPKARALKSGARLAAARSRCGKALDAVLVVLDSQPGRPACSPVRFMAGRAGARAGGIAQGGRK